MRPVHTRDCLGDSLRIPAGQNIGKNARVARPLVFILGIRGAQQKLGSLRTTENVAFPTNRERLRRIRGRRMTVGTTEGEIGGTRR